MEFQNNIKPITPFKKFLVSYLYFVQGIFLNVPSTVTLTYSKIPPYDVLGYFSLALIPFSLKFLSAPFIEKYTSVKYGRRKTWLIISLLIASLQLFVASNFSTNEQDQVMFAMMMMITIFFISLEDICTDALAIKQLQSSETASYLQVVYQLLGGVFGSLFFLQITSVEFAGRFGYSKAFVTVPLFLKLIGLMTFTSAILIHFLYEQTVLKQEQNGVPHSLLEVIQHYKHFCDPKFQLCRQALTNLTIMQGLNYFSSSYAVELIKGGHLSKQTLTTFGNFMILPILLQTKIISKYFSQLQLAHKRIRIALTLRLILMSILFFLDVKDFYFALLGIAMLGLLSNTQFFFNSLITNTVHDSKFAGMYTTMMASTANFGNNTAIHLEMINNLGYSACSIGGFIYTVGYISGFGKIQRWIKNGEKDRDFGGCEEQTEHLNPKDRHQ